MALLVPPVWVTGVLDSILGDLDGERTAPRRNSEVVVRAKRHNYTAEFKQRILEEVDAATGHGGIGAVLRREGIYSSTLHAWRKERDAAVHKAFSQKRGPQTRRNPLAGENEKLRRQNQRLQEELEKAHIVIDVQKKVAKLLGRPIPEIPSTEK